MQGYEIIANKPDRKGNTTIVVDSDGDHIACTSGHVSSTNQEKVKAVKEASLLGTPIQIVAPFGPVVSCDLDSEDDMQVLAALFSAAPGRTRLLEAPQALISQFQEMIEDYSENNDFSEE